MALFEVVSYLIIEVMTLSEEKHKNIKIEFGKFLANEKFTDSTTYIVDSNKSVNNRFTLVEEIIEEIRNA